LLPEPRNPTIARYAICGSSSPTIEIEDERPAIAKEVEGLIESSRKKRGLEARTSSSRSPESIRLLLKGIRIADPIHSGDLHVFGLSWAQTKPIDYLTLDQALAAEVMAISEVSEGGSVPRLLVVNRSDRSVFLMAGEQLIGASKTGWSTPASWWEPGPSFRCRSRASSTDDGPIDPAASGPRAHPRTMRCGS
jgi:hypothetical protein